MLANDFNNLEMKIPVLFAATIFPVIVVVLAIIMILMLSYVACLSILIAIVIFPLQILVGKWGGVILS